MRVWLPIQMLARASRPPRSMSLSLAQAGQHGVDGGRADVDGGRARILAVALHLVEHGVQARARRVVIEAGQVLVVEEAPAISGLPSIAPTVAPP
jgi:hypothetical protein